MNLDDLILHPRSRMMAENMAANLPHGLIVEGPAGTGVVTVARAMAAGSQEFILLPKKKVKNELVVDMKEGSVIIDDIRQLYEQTRTKNPGDHVYIIDTGEKSMTAQAQNAFLKLLEEPHPGLHFIIATHRMDQMLPTIVSRSQQLTLLPVTDKQSAGLIDTLNITDATKRTRLAFVGRGLPALIKRLADDEKQYDERVGIMTDAKTMLGDDVYAKLTVIHRYRENRANTLTLIDDINHQIRTVVRSHPDQRLIGEIARFLDTRNQITAGGNIRLHLTAAVI